MNSSKFDVKAYQKAYRDKHRERLREADRQRYLKNRTAILEQKRNKYANSDELRAQRSEYLIEWRKRNPDKVKEYNSDLRTNHKAYCRYYELTKEKRRIQARPPWVDRDSLFAAYTVPDGCVADHIIPLLGKNVCGLDVPWNIQPLTDAENNFKRNSFDGTYENCSWKERFIKKYSTR